MKEILVIGAGAAGIMAALAAAESGARVHLFEKNDIVGKKMDEGFYHLNKSHDICKMIVDYLNNGDTIKQKREQIIGELSTRNEEEIGNIIANILRMDFEER